VSARLSPELRVELATLLAGRPEVARAIFVTGTARPVLAFEYDDRPATVADAQRMVQVLVAPVLGELAREISFSAGGPEEIAAIAAGGVIVHQRS
jgi:hypothetical protein